MEWRILPEAGELREGHWQCIHTPGLGLDLFNLGVVARQAACIHVNFTDYNSATKIFLFTGVNKQPLKAIVGCLPGETVVLR